MTGRGPYAALATLVLAAAFIGAATLYRKQAQDDATQETAPASTNDAVAGMAPDAIASTSTTTRAPRASAAMERAEERAKPEAKRARLQRRVDDANARFSAQYRTEKADPAWANAAERDLAELASSDLTRSMNADIQDLDVDCRATTCKITGNFATVTQGDDWFTLYMTNAAGKLSSATYKYEKNPDGRQRMVVYAIARK